MDGHSKVNTMGFDFNIVACYHLDPATGKPFVYTMNQNHTMERNFTLHVEIPEEYREFVQLRGKVLHMYCDSFGDQMFCPMVEFAEQFPEWEDVHEWIIDHGWTDDDWSEETHWKFKEAADWFAQQPVTYLAMWSY